MLRDARGGGDFDGLGEAAVESMLGLGALADVAASDELLAGRKPAREGVASLDEVARLGGGIQ